MHHQFLCGLICLLLGTTAVPADGLAAFDQANRQFSAGDYAAAASTYEQILAADGPRAAVFYNLGNSYQRLGQYGPAILAYERARLLTPRDPDLLANLALARKAAAAFEEPGPHPRFDGALHYLSRNEWSWLVASAALVLGGLAGLGGVMSLPRRWMRQTVLVVAGLAGLAIMGGGGALYVCRDEATRGIVLTEKAAVRISPFEKAEVLLTPGLGRIVHIRGHSGGFHYIEVPGTSHHGWISSKDVAAITSEPSTR